MDMVLIGLTVLMAVGMGWSIGANDAANSMGTAVGARVLTLRQAILLIAVCGFLGAFLQGESVSKTIGKGIVDLTALPKADASCLALTAMFGSCLWVVLATYWKMPISTSHSIVGAVWGGLALPGLSYGHPLACSRHLRLLGLHSGRGCHHRLRALPDPPEVVSTPCP